MKRLLLALVMIGSATLFQSCEGDQGPAGPAGPSGPNSLVFELNNVNFGYNATDGYNIYGTFSTEIGGNLFDAETVLIYRLSGTIDSQTPIWQLIPRTLYLNNGDEMDYDFDFSKEDFKIYARGTYDLTETPEFINGQTFRIVIVPGTFAKKAVDKFDYNAVIAAYGIDDSHVKILQPIVRK